MRRSLNIVTALKAESEPLIDRFGLERSRDQTPFPLYTHPSGTIRLAVSGVGRESAGRTVSELAGSSGSSDRTSWLNVGIAGHRDLPVGTPVLAHRITDSATGESWELAHVTNAPCRTASVTTVDRPVEEFTDGHVFDMEASGFYAAAAQASSPQQVGVIKIISDNDHASLREISGKKVRDLMSRNVPVIARIVGTLGKPPKPGNLQSFSELTLYRSLDKDFQEFLQEIGLTHGFTFQELRQVMEMGIDFQMWGEIPVQKQWEQFQRQKGHPEKNLKEAFLTDLKKRWESLRQGETVYDRTERPRPVISNLSRKKLRLRQESNGVYGMCPVASEKTVCCNLRTIDAAQGCGFGCTYCSIQTFYDPQEIGVDTNLAQKLENIELDASRRYHIGSGQSSDSLLLGNREGILDAQFQFARNHPNVVLEFKTKSKNIGFVLQADVPPNVFISWSLNPQVIIDHEELRTASLVQRLSSARRVADRGIRVGFHFHPIVHYRGWKEDYQDLVKTVISRFSPEEVAFVSLGTLTFIKPAMKSLRQQGIPSKVLQIPMEEAAGKLSYPVAMKEEMFGRVWEAFRSWHQEVFFYLCMEARELWEKVFGFCYENNEVFETAMLDALFDKLDLSFDPLFKTSDPVIQRRTTPSEVPLWPS